MKKQCFKNEKGRNEKFYDEKSILFQFFEVRFGLQSTFPLGTFPNIPLLWRHCE